MYCWIDPSTNRKDNELESAADLLIWGDPEEEGINDAHSFFLGNNSFLLPTRSSSQRLTENVRKLSEAGFSNRVHGLVVWVAHDPNPHDREDEEEEDVWQCEDYDDEDNMAPGSRAFRILRPLTKLQRLQALHIILREDNAGFLLGFGAPHHHSEGLPKVAGVIAKLKETVLAGSRSPKVEVSHQIVIEDRVVDQSDITWLWNAPSQAEMEYMEGRENLARLEDELRLMLSHLRDERIGLRMGLRDSRGRKELAIEAIVQKEQGLKEQLEKSSVLLERMSMLDPTLRDRFLISKIAADPAWEKTAEGLLNQVPSDEESSDE
ncbi:hypothetical protein MMC10_010990 [Thelotrema lepadinum]|nr:hypothetical protein [Thelotrema lepadinum]